MTTTVTLSPFQMDLLIAEFDHVFWTFIVIDENNDYDSIDVICKGLTPRMHCFMEEQVEKLINAAMKHTHPTVSKKIIKSLMASINASISALFAVRPKTSFDKEEVKEYLTALVRSLLDVRTGSSTLLGDYVVVDANSTDISILT